MTNNASNGMYQRYCKLRDERHLKDADVIRGAKVPQSTMSEWKKGKYTPKADKIEKIAAFFEVPVSYFYSPDIITPEGYILETKRLSGDRVAEERTEVNKFLQQHFSTISKATVEYVDELTCLKNVLNMNKDLKDVEFTAEQLDKIIEYAKWITRDVK